MSIRHRFDSTGIKRAWLPRIAAALFAACVVAFGALLPVQADVIELNGNDAAPVVRSAPAARSVDENQALEDQLLVAFIKRSTEPIDVSRFNMGFSELNGVYTKVLSDHPELFDVRPYWVGATGDSTLETITPGYLLEDYSYEDVRDMRGLFAKGIADAMSWIPADGTDLDKAKAAHDWLCSHVDYDYDSYNEHIRGGFNFEPTTYGLIVSNREPFYPYCAYGALAACKCVCQGYANAFKLLMDKVGVKCETISAHDHEWNLVLIDGDWYHVDATWDSQRWDPKVAPFEQRFSVPEWVDINYDMYFMKSDQGIIDCEMVYHDDDPGYEPVHSGYISYTAGPATNTHYDTTTANSWDGAPPRPGIQPQNQVTNFDLMPYELILDPGQSALVQAVDLVPTDANRYMAVWWSSDPSVADVLSDGTVVAMGERGTATIYCNFAGLERTCRVTVGSEEPVTPEFLAPQADTSGGVALRIPVLIPQIEGVDWGSSRLDYAIDGKKARSGSINYYDAETIPNADREDVLWFTIPLSSIEMAQTVTASFTYVQDGEERMIEREPITLEEAIMYPASEGGPTQFEQRLIDYGHYAQLFFSEQNKWTLGSDYREMQTFFTSGYDREQVLAGLAEADMYKDLGVSNIKKITMSVRLDSEATVELNLYLKKAGTCDASATFCGETFKAAKATSTRYRITIPAIRAQQLNERIYVSGRAGNNFEAGLTPMTYAKAVLSSSALGENGDNAMSALYYYHLSAKECN